MGARGKNFYNTLARQYGYEKEAEEIQELYLGGNKRDAEALVPLEWLEASNLVGPESYVKERIAAYKYPRVIEFRDELPKNAMGKIMKDELIPR